MGPASPNGPALGEAQEPMIDVLPPQDVGADVDAPSRAARQPTCEPSSLYSKITALLRKIRQERQRPLFVLISHSIDFEVAEEVYRWRKQLKDAGKNDD
jgi:hypothetical protein